MLSFSFPEQGREGKFPLLLSSQLDEAGMSPVRVPPPIPYLEEIRKRQLRGRGRERSPHTPSGWLGEGPRWWGKR